MVCAYENNLCTQDHLSCMSLLLNGANIAKYPWVMSRLLLHSSTVLHNTTTCSASHSFKTDIVIVSPDEEGIITAWKRKTKQNSIIMFLYGKITINTFTILTQGSKCFV